MHPQAKIAIYAAKNRKKWGKYAARKYVEKRLLRRNIGLYILAAQLEAAK